VTVVILGCTFPDGFSFDVKGRFDDAAVVQLKSRFDFYCFHVGPVLGERVVQFDIGSLPIHDEHALFI
jgi:hypothetical protein